MAHTNVAQSTDVDDNSPIAFSDGSVTYVQTGGSAPEEMIASANRRGKAAYKAEAGDSYLQQRASKQHHIFK